MLRDFGIEGNGIIEAGCSDGGERKVSRSGATIAKIAAVAAARCEPTGPTANQFATLAHSDEQLLIPRCVPSGSRWATHQLRPSFRN